MRILIVICGLLAFEAQVLAGEKAPLPSATGTLIGPDGQKWVVEGCAAYPVSSAANTREKSVQMSKWIKPIRKAPKTSEPKSRK